MKRKKITSLERRRIRSVTFDGTHYIFKGTARQVLFTVEENSIFDPDGMYFENNLNVPPGFPGPVGIPFTGSQVPNGWKRSKP